MLAVSGESYHSQSPPSTSLPTTQTTTAFQPVGFRYSHLTNKSILINWSSLLSSRQPWDFRPHLLHILQHHVAMSIKRLDSREKLSVVAAGDEYLGMGADCGLEDGEGSGGEFVLLELRDFELAVNSISSCAQIGKGSAKDYHLSLPNRGLDDVDGLRTQAEVKLRWFRLHT